MAKAKWPWRFRKPGLTHLARVVAGLNMKPMHIVDSNWEARYLSVNQVECARIEAYASCKIAHGLLIEN